MMARKPKPIPLPLEVWVMAWHGHTMAGSFSHVGCGEKFYRTEAECQQAIDTILQSNFRVLTIPPMLLATAAALCRQIGLLTNDALIVAVMQANGLTRLASADGDFGARAGSAVGSLLGLELEGLSAEDREFEVARQVGRYVASAAITCKFSRAGSRTPRPWLCSGVPMSKRSRSCCSQ